MLWVGSINHQDAYARSFERCLKSCYKVMETLLAYFPSSHFQSFYTSAYLGPQTCLAVSPCLGSVAFGLGQNHDK